MYYNNPMEHITPPEQIFLPYITKARDFVADNSPSYDELEAYRHDRLSRVHEGQKIWVAKEVGPRVRIYELQDGTRHSKDAVLAWDVEAVGLDAYRCDIYRDGAQVVFDDSMASVKNWLDRRKLNPIEAEEALL